MLWANSQIWQGVFEASLLNQCVGQFTPVNVEDIWFSGMSSLQGMGVDVHGLADGLKGLVEAGLARAAGTAPAPPCELMLFCLQMIRALSFTLVQPVLQAPAQQCYPTFIHVLTLSCMSTVFTLLVVLTLPLN